MTVSAFIVRESAEGPRLLLHRHKRLDLFLQPGGHVELDEHPWAALAREVREETGYDLAQLDVLQPPSRMTVPSLDSTVLHPMPVSVRTHDFDSDGRHRHIDLGFAFVTSSEPNGRPAEGESEVLVWTSREELSALDAIPANVRQVADFVLGQARVMWDRVATTSFAFMGIQAGLPS